MSDYRIEEVKAGYIVIVEDSGDPIVDPQGQALLFHRRYDAQKWITQRVETLQHWANPNGYR